MRVKYKGSGKTKPSCSNEAPKMNLLYALLSRGEQQTSPDVVTGMLKVLSIDVYVLLDLVATL